MDRCSQDETANNLNAGPEFEVSADGVYLRLLAVISLLSVMA